LAFKIARLFGSSIEMIFTDAPSVVKPEEE